MSQSDVGGSKMIQDDQYNMLLDSFGFFLSLFTFALGAKFRESDHY